MFEHFLTKIQKTNLDSAGQFHSPRKIVCPAESKLVFRILTFNPAPAFPPAELRRAKQNNFLSIFCILRAPFFLLKGIENCFALMFGLMPNGGNASRPQPAFDGQSRRAKIPSPRPPSFLPACLGFALKFFERADGGATTHRIFFRQVFDQLQSLE